MLRSTDFFDFYINTPYIDKHITDLLYFLFTFYIYYGIIVSNRNRRKTRNMRKKIKVSKATLGRLPKYLDFLKSLDDLTYENVSATFISKSLNLGEVQVRKDFASVSSSGKPKTGYLKEKLINDIESILRLDKHETAVIVGAGKLGQALLGYDGFSEYGLSILAAFDNDESKCITSFSGKQILHISKLKEFCIENNVRIGIITVPGMYAQDVCNNLVESGIKAIWSFAPKDLEVPKNVTVLKENLALSLAHLSSMLNKN